MVCEQTTRTQNSGEDENRSTRLLHMWTNTCTKRQMSSSRLSMSLMQYHETLGLCMSEVNLHAMCTHNNVALNVEFRATEDTGSTMLGLQPCLAVQLISLNCEDKSACNDCHNNCQIHTLGKDGNSISFGESNGDAKVKLCEEYLICFRGGGFFSGEYHIDLKQDAEPAMHTPRRIPESIKNI